MTEITEVEGESHGEEEYVDEGEDGQKVREGSSMVIDQLVF